MNTQGPPKLSRPETVIRVYLVVVQHFKELLVALLRDEDALSRSDTATAGQAVIQRDLCFLQLLLPTILQTHGTLNRGKEQSSTLVLLLHTSVDQAFIPTWLTWT